MTYYNDYYYNEENFDFEEMEQIFEDQIDEMIEEVTEGM
jgi:hypothetical protein